MQWCGCERPLAEGPASVGIIARRPVEVAEKVIAKTGLGCQGLGAPNKPGPPDRMKINQRSVLVEHNATGGHFKIRNLKTRLFHNAVNLA